MSCTHPRQPRLNEPDRALPCAWPDCPEGFSGARDIVIPVRELDAPMMYTDPDAARFGRIEHVRYVRATWRDSDTGVRVWRWDPE